MFEIISQGTAVIYDSASRYPLLSWLVNFCQKLKSLKISSGCILLWLGLVWMQPGKSGKWRARGNRKELGGGNRKEDMDRNQSLAGNSCYLVDEEDIDTVLLEDVDAASLFDQHWPSHSCRSTKIKAIQKCKGCVNKYMYFLEPDGDKRERGLGAFAHMVVTGSMFQTGGSRSW